MSDVKEKGSVALLPKAGTDVPNSDALQRARGKFSWFLAEAAAYRTGSVQFSSVSFTL
jgi:hypothetical protein